jgi:formylglycine-generating enzyme
VRNRLDLAFQKLKWHGGLRLKLAYVPSLALCLVIGGAAASAIGTNDRLLAPAKTPAQGRFETVTALLEAAQRRVDQDQNLENDALAALDEARRIDPKDPRIDIVRETLAKKILGEYDSVLGPDRPFERVAGARLRFIIDRAKRFKPDFLGIAQYEAMLVVLRAKAWSGHPDCEGCPEMVIIPAGSLLLGSPPGEEGRQAHEGPQFRVTLAKPFLLGRYEVTRGEYAKYAAETSVAAAGTGCTEGQYLGSGNAHDKDASWRAPGFEQDDSHPVICVSWLDAVGYAEWLSKKTGKKYRLPSEAEWEYAVRAGTATPFSTTGLTVFSFVVGPDAPLMLPKAKHGRYLTKEDLSARSLFRPGTSLAGTFPENAFRLHDMHGNAAEWVQDCWLADYGMAAGDGRPRFIGTFCKDRAVRGGSWAGNEAMARSAARSFADANLRRTDLGFRVARDLD